MKNTKDTALAAVIPFYPVPIINHIWYHSYIDSTTFYRRIGLKSLKNINKFSPIWLVVSDKPFLGSYRFSKAKEDPTYWECEDESFNDYGICRSGLKAALRTVKANPKLLKALRTQKYIYLQTLVEYDK